MRNAAQCVGRVLRGKTDWGLMVFADKVKAFAILSCTRNCVTEWCSQRFARADKRAKLPRWINQYITDTAANLSTDMALVLAKLFMRQISQTHSEDQTGISLWTIDDIEKEQAKRREVELQQEAEARAKDVSMVNEDEDEYGDFGFSDRVLGEMDLDVQIYLMMRMHCT